MDLEQKMTKIICFLIIINILTITYGIYVFYELAHINNENVLDSIIYTKEQLLCFILIIISIIPFIGLSVIFIVIKLDLNGEDIF